MGTLSTIENFDLAAARLGRGSPPPPRARRSATRRGAGRRVRRDIDVRAPVGGSDRRSGRSSRSPAPSRLAQRTCSCWTSRPPRCTAGGGRPRRDPPGGRARRRGDLHLPPSRRGDRDRRPGGVPARRQDDRRRAARRLRPRHLVELIAGEALAGAEGPATPPGPGEPALRRSGTRAPTTAAIDLALHKGEILGVSGVLGSGREEVAATLFGARPGVEGEVDVEAVGSAEPAAGDRGGRRLRPRDRHREGAVMKMTVRENMTLPALRPLRA